MRWRMYQKLKIVFQWRRVGNQTGSPCRVNGSHCLTGRSKGSGWPVQPEWTRLLKPSVPGLLCSDNPDVLSCSFLFYLTLLQSAVNILSDPQASIATSPRALDLGLVWIFQTCASSHQRSFTFGRNANERNLSKNHQLPRHKFILKSPEAQS